MPEKEIAPSLLPEFEVKFNKLLSKLYKEIPNCVEDVSDWIDCLDECPNAGLYIGDLNCHSFALFLTYNKKFSVDVSYRGAYMFMFREEIEEMAKVLGAETKSNCPDLWGANLTFKDFNPSSLKLNYGPTEEELFARQLEYEQLLKQREEEKRKEEERRRSSGILKFVF